MTNLPKEHVHTEECWEPGSGCDMGRNEKYALAVPREAVIPSNERLSEIRAAHDGCTPNDCEVAWLLLEIERLTRALEAKETEWRLQEQLKQQAQEALAVALRAHETNSERCEHYWRMWENRCLLRKDHRGEHWYAAPQHAISVDVDFGSLPCAEAPAETLERCRGCDCDGSAGRVRHCMHERGLIPTMETSSLQGPGPCPIHSRCVLMLGHQGPCDLQ